MAPHSSLSPPRTVVAVMAAMAVLMGSSLVTVISARGIPEDDPGLNEPWLADYDGGTIPRYQMDYMDGMQADAPAAAPPASHKHTGGGEEAGWVCPPPPENKAPSYYCGMKQCKADSQCRAGPHQKCCFNGCVYTCLTTLPPPPLVDWIKEPPRRLLAGNSWLVQGPEMVVPGGKDEVQESCSTDFDPAVEDALLCSHGYICHILDPGDKAKGIPNRGSCMKDDSQAVSTGPRRFRLATSDHDDQENVCVFENAIFVDGTKFMYQHHQCECLKNTITCTVGEDQLEK